MWRLPGHPAEGLCANGAHLSWGWLQLYIQGPGPGLSQGGAGQAMVAKVQDQTGSQLAK